MSTGGNTHEKIARLFARRPVADIGTLQSALGTRSRTTVFRALSKKGYLTSYSHAGRYYTLEGIPQFDDDGLWVYGEALFSKYKTLRSTIIHLIDRSEAGRTHSELQVRLHLRLHDTLHDLVEAKKIGRMEIERLYLYVSADQAIAEAQIAQRRQLLLSGPSPLRLPDPTVVIEILLAFIHHPDKGSAELVSVLRRQGHAVSCEEIEAVFTQYALGKKNRVSKRSRR